VYAPLVLPFPYSRIARWINRFIIVRAIRRWMHATGIERTLVWTFLPTALSLDLIDVLDPELVVYYCIDDFENSSSGARSIQTTEHRLFREADLVFVTSDRLRERARRFRERVDVFPFAVDFGRYEAVRNSADGVPADLQAVRGPIVGYVGGLHRWVDQDLAARAAGRLPHVTFVFIGPAQCDVSQLARVPTIRLLGTRSPQQLPGYIKGFDVGIVPYALTEYTANVYPTKLNEYLAMGKPVVATGLPEIKRFNQMHGDIVATADDSEAFASKILSALQERDETGTEKRIAVARENSWDARLEAMGGLIDEALAARRARQSDRDGRRRLP
jgi:glycosyltransferase involved in cell wall biosynthesis